MYVPNLTFLTFFRMPKDHGATGLLIEYEDMFPFEGMLKDVAFVVMIYSCHIFEHAFKWKHVFVFDKESCSTMIFIISSPILFGHLPTLKLYIIIIPFLMVGIYR